MEASFDLASEDHSVAVADVPIETAGAPDAWVADLPGEVKETVDVDPACAPGSGCFLDPCADNSDCLYGWCVEHMGNQVCS